MGVVQQRRNLNGGENGRDVTAVQRALEKAGVRRTNPSRRYDKATQEQVRAFQRTNKLTPDGVYGPNTHKRLAPYFDAYGGWLMGSGSSDGTPKSTRELIVSTATYGYTRRVAIHYASAARGTVQRRMEGVRREIKPPRVPNWEDCSSFVTWCYWVAGAEDPNGLDYNGTGYTGTLCQHGRPVVERNSQPGDLVFYGRGAPWHHVAVIVSPGRVVSHGSEGGPYLLSIRYRSDLGQIRSYLR